MQHVDHNFLVCSHTVEDDNVDVRMDPRMDINNEEGDDDLMEVNKVANKELPNQCFHFSD